MSQKDFENLLLWQLGRKYRIDISEVIKSFPASAWYSLSDLLKRISRSIEDNIAEGMVDIIIKRIFNFVELLGDH